MAETSRSLSTVSTNAPLVPSSRHQSVAVFPDGSVVWGEPETVETPLPYPGYELPPSKNPVASGEVRDSIPKGIGFSFGAGSHWLLAGGAIALFSVGLGAFLPRMLSLTSPQTGQSPCPYLGPLELQRYSIKPLPALMPGL